MKAPLPVVLRGLAVACLLFAPLSSPLELPHDELHIVYVVDQSESISEPQLRIAELIISDAVAELGADRVGVVAFARAPRVVRSFSGAPSVLRQPLERPETMMGGTNIEEALTMAGDMLHRGGVRRVVLLSDGHATAGLATDAAAELHRRGIEVDTVPLQSLPGEQRIWVSLSPRNRQAHAGQSVVIDATVTGPPLRSVLLWWERNGEHLHSQWVSLNSSGQTRLTHFHDSDVPPGNYLYGVQVVASQGNHRGATLASAHTHVDVLPAQAPSLPAAAQVAFDGPAVTVTAHVADGAADVPAAVRVEVVGGHERVEPLYWPVQRKSPASWTASGFLRADSSRLIVANVLDAQGQVLVRAAALQPVGDEIVSEQPDRLALAHIAEAGGGAFDPSMAGAMRPDGPMGSRPLATWPLWLLCALCLLCMDLFVRRFPANPGSLLTRSGLRGPGWRAWFDGFCGRRAQVGRG